MVPVEQIPEWTEYVLKHFPEAFNQVFTFVVALAGSITDVTRDIARDASDKNWTACVFPKKCPYYGLCWQHQDLKEFRANNERPSDYLRDLTDQPVDAPADAA